VAPAKKAATYADIEALPEHLVGQIINGELIVSPRGRLRHGIAETQMVIQLGNAFRGGGGGPERWMFVVEPELHLGNHVLVPDVAGWRVERAPTDGDLVGITIAPDWICEVASPSTAGIDRAGKMPIYARHQVGHLWMVEPASQLLEAFRRQEEHWLVVGLFTGAALVRCEPFAEIEIDLSRCWVPRPPGSVAEPPVVWQSAG
jgi:Uma2 family endonuclease